ncbi:MAG: ABC transporter substrate-binding protein [Betaproteobacteria bacterium]|nr:ABC transporter substrate-binding protein [Betaproteobacteria bacterium]
MRKIILAIAAGVLAGALSASPAAAAEKLKIGFITTLSGPTGIIGKHMKDSVELALEQLHGKVGGLETEVIFGDDQFKPDVGLQVADKMVKDDKVQFVSGVIWSNVMLAVAPAVTEKGVFMIGTNAGPHELAGSQCNRLFFTTSWQNDETPEAMGEFMQKQGINDVYLMAPNYAAGKDMLAGFKRTFKGRIVDEVYTKLGQQDYQAEISQLRAKNPKAVFVFYPGAMGINFIRQYDQAGLHGKIPLYSAFTVDDTTLPALGDNAIGLWSAGYWSSELDNPANRKYVSDFRKKYGYTPSFYGAEAYDGIMLIDSAVRAVKGNLADKEGMIKAMEKADYASTRGHYTYNVNHFPIENFYLLRAEKGPHGVVMKVERTIFKDHKDAYYQECKMK